MAGFPVVDHSTKTSHMMGAYSLSYFDRELSMVWLLFKDIFTPMERGE